MRRHRSGFWRALGVVLLLVAAGETAAMAPALAQAHNPFSVGISEGGGSTSGFSGWILAQQGLFERSIAGAVKASKRDGSAMMLLSGLSFLYGVLHAAGPGHGKAVLAAYMVASRRALRRGILLAFLAALLQAGVAIALVGLLSLLFHATATSMREGAAAIEKLSYCGVALLGAVLVWRKGRAFVAAYLALMRQGGLQAAQRSTRAGFGEPQLAFATFLRADGPPPRSATRYGPRSATLMGDHGASGRFACTAPHDQEHGPGCGHCHAPDPSRLENGFSWRDAVATVFAAGARPCSGAILVLVFAAAQGIFAAGVTATLVMAFGTALTTAALAALAVLAKGIALRLGGTGAGRGELAARAVELMAAGLVLAVGLSLLAGIGPLQALS